MGSWTAPASPASNLRRIVLLWLVLRLVLSAWVLVAAANRPPVAFDAQFARWEQQAPRRALADTLLRPWYRWDVEHYVTIAERGYSTSDGTLSFHPLFPLLGKLTAAALGLHVLWGLFIVSNVAALLFLLAFERLARLDLPADEAWRACIAFVLLPSAYILYAPYTESLFLLWSVLSVYHARQKRWWLAGLMAALAALTRQQGVLLVVPLVWEAWTSSERSWRRLVAHPGPLLGIGLAPLGLMVWLAYRNVSFGDATVEWSRPYSFFYGLLISPSAAHIISDQRVTFPWTALWVALSNFGPTNAVDLTGAAIYVTLFIALGARMWSIRPSYFVYTLATLLLSLAYSTGVPYSYMGLIRHCLLAFPIAIVLGATIRPTWILGMMKVSGVLSLLGLPVLYVWKLLWVP